MIRKQLRSSSFQEEVVNFLKENSFRGFTAKEILEETNQRSSKSRSEGSISGTLKVLCEDGWVTKSDGRPFRYSYRNEHSDPQIAEETAEPTTKSIITMENPQDPFQKTQNRIKDLKNKLASVSNQIQKLQKEQFELQIELKTTEEILLDFSKLNSEK